MAILFQGDFFVRAKNRKILTIGSLLLGAVHLGGLQVSRGLLVLLILLHESQGAFEELVRV